MIINDNLKTTINTVVDKPAPTDNKASPTVRPSTGAVPVGTDTAKLSPQLQALQATIASSPVFDSKKVDMIRDEIESGRFSVDSEKVADSMVNDVISFLKK